MLPFYPQYSRPGYNFISSIETTPFPLLSFSRSLARLCLLDCAYHTRSFPRSKFSDCTVVSKELSAKRAPTTKKKKRKPIAPLVPPATFFNTTIIKLARVLERFSHTKPTFGEAKGNQRSSTAEMSKYQHKNSPYPCECTSVQNAVLRTKKRYSSGLFLVSKSWKVWSNRRA